MMGWGGITLIAFSGEGWGRGRREGFFKARDSK